MPRSRGKDELESLRSEADSQGDAKVLKGLREMGARSARERVMGLLDDDSFVETGAFVKHRSGDHIMHLHTPMGDGVVAGHGKIDGRRVVCFSQDYSVLSGTMGEMHAGKISQMVEFADKSQLPIVGIGFMLRKGTDHFRGPRNSIRYERIGSRPV